MRRRLEQVLADVLHSIRLCLFRLGKPVKPDRLRHFIPPVQAPQWHRCGHAGTCPKEQMCRAGNQSLGIAVYEWLDTLHKKDEVSLDGLINRRQYRLEPACSSGQATRADG